MAIKLIYMIMMREDGTMKIFLIF